MKGLQRVLMGALALAAWSCGGVEGEGDFDPDGVDEAEVLGNGLEGQYFDAANLTAPKLTRLDATVSFDWGTGSPAPSVGADTFSVRWTGTVTPRFSETYTFYVESDDGVRLSVAGRLLIDGWRDHAASESAATITLTAGRAVPIVLTYYENGGRASCRLRWSSRSEPKAIIPSARLAPPGSPPAPEEPPPGAGSGVKWHPGHYVYAPNPFNGATWDGAVERALNSPAITGVQVRLMWNRDNLEVRRGQYNFSKFEQLLAHYQAKGKRIQFLMLDQDYWGFDCVPAYMRDPGHPDYDPKFKGGQVKSGNRCVPKLWIPAVMDRLIAYYRAIGARFDREPYFEGLSTTETAIPGLGDPDYSNAAIVAQLIRLTSSLPISFPTSLTWLHANWTQSTDAVVANAYNKGVGIDGPDLTVIGPKNPNRKPTWGYPCYNIVFANRGGCSEDYYRRMPLGIAGQVGLERSIQDGYTMGEIFDFAITSPRGLRVSHVFWNQPYLTPGFSFTGTILPYLEARQGYVMNSACPENIVRVRGGCRTN